MCPITQCESNCSLSPVPLTCIGFNASFAYVRACMHVCVGVCVWVRVMLLVLSHWPLRWLQTVIHNPHTHTHTVYYSIHNHAHMTTQHKQYISHCNSETKAYVKQMLHSWRYWIKTTFQHFEHDARTLSTCVMIYMIMDSRRVQAAPVCVSSVYGCLHRLISKWFSS